MTIRQFTSDPAFRQRYWARNHVGWRHMDETLPNAGHRALAELEHAGVVSGVITQNVDLLHTKAGSRTVINLHGTYAQVICLDCGHTMSRAALADLLEAANPRVRRAGGVGRRYRGRARRRRGRRRHHILAILSDHRLFAVRRDAQARHRVFRRERAERPGGRSVFACRRSRRTAGRRVVADGVFGLPVRPPCRGGRHSGRDHQPRPHPRRRAGDGENRQRVLPHAGAAGR